MKIITVEEKTKVLDRIKKNLEKVSTHYVDIN